MTKLKISTGMYFGSRIVIVCDMQCHKAWGSQNRPCVYLQDEDEQSDDYYYLADHELGDAPANPGTSEGDEYKPLTPDGPHNKWCARECERSVMVFVERENSFELIDFDRRFYNIAPHYRDDK